MKLSDLSPEALEKIKLVRWDRIIEKHEEPEDWSSVLQYNQASITRKTMQEQFFFRNYLSLFSS